MPLRFFICPDGQQIEVSKCLEKCPRPEGRCLSLPTLHSISSSRPWVGKPSTTQLLNPTRLEFLKITKDYATDPQSMAYSLLGTRHHQKLEAVARKIEGLEVEKYLDGDPSGTLDLLEPDDLKEGYWELIDYKTWGSFSVAKVLGIGSKNSGYERHQAELQLNNYRIKVSQMGFPISHLSVQCTVRDGGTRTAYSNQIGFKMKKLPLAILDDDYVRDYFAKKREALLTALDTMTLPPFCPYDERWANKRCKKACPVVEYCPEGSRMTRLFKEVART